MHTRRTYDKLIATIRTAKARARLRVCFGMAYPDQQALNRR